MKKNIPGEVAIEGREFLYIQCEGLLTFKDLFPRIITFGSSPLPQKGGAINENTVIEIPDGRKFFGLSYKGDIKAWRRKVEECASALKVLHASIQNGHIIMSDGKKLPLSECVITTDEERCSF